MQVVAQDLVTYTMTARARRHVWQAPCATRARQSACLTSRSCRGNSLCRSVCLSVHAVSPPVPALCVPCSALRPHQHQEVARFSSLSLQARESPSLSFFFSVSSSNSFSPLHSCNSPALVFSPHQRCRQNFVLQPTQTLTLELVTMHQAFSSLCGSRSVKMEHTGYNEQGPCQVAQHGEGLRTAGCHTNPTCPGVTEVTLMLRAGSAFLVKFCPR